MPTFKFIMLFCTMWGIVLFESIVARPQDMEGAALMAFATVKETVENGAAARDNKEFEVFGAKVKNEMSVGFGDVMKTKRSASDSSSSESDEDNNRRRRDLSHEVSSSEDYSTSWGSSEESAESNESNQIEQT